MKKEDVENKRLRSAQTVLRECFWGDYDFSPQKILDRLDRGEPGFDKFLFSKIIEQSRYPSYHLRNIFTQNHLHQLLDRYLKQVGHKKRVRLVASNLTGQYDLVREYSWKH